MSLWRTILLAINVVGVRFGGAAISFASQILLARLLTQSELGVVFLGMSAAAFLSLLVTGGYPQLAITCLPRYYALGRPNLVKAFHAAFLHDGLWISLATFAVYAVIYFLLTIDDGMKTALLFGCLSAVPSAFIRINSSVANSVRRYALSFVPDSLFRPGLLLVYLALAWVMDVRLTTAQVLWAFVMANAAVAAGQALLIGQDGAVCGFKWSGLHRLAPFLRGRAAALALVGVVATSFSDIVTLLAGFFLHPADVAIVGVAIRLAALAGFITQASQQFIMPDLTAVMARGAPGKVHALLLRVNLISIITIMGFIVGAILFGNYALRIFGAQYEMGQWPLVLFMVSQVFRAAGGMNQHLLSLAGYQIRTAGSCAIAVVILMVATVVLTPKFGVMGLACAVIIADAAWAIMLASQAWQLTGRRGDIIGLLAARKA